MERNRWLRSRGVVVVLTSQMGQQMLGQQLGVDAMMRSFLEMQNQNALFRQMNPAPPSNGGL